MSTSPPKSIREKICVTSPIGGTYTKAGARTESLSTETTSVVGCSVTPAWGSRRYDLRGARRLGRSRPDDFDPEAF